MRFTTTINNVKAKEWGLSLPQAYLFTWFYELPSWADRVIIGNEIYWFASKNKAIEELGFMLTDKRDTMYRYYKQIIFFRQTMIPSVSLAPAVVEEIVCK